MPKKNSDNVISVLDEFHRNKKITECVKDPDFSKLLKELLYKNDIDTLLMCIEAQIKYIKGSRQYRVDSYSTLYTGDESN